MNSNELQTVVSLLEKQFKQLNRQLKEYDVNVLRIVREINIQKELPYSYIESEQEIKINSYLDNQYLDREYKHSSRPNTIS